MHNNTYTVVGTSVLNGVRKVRFANGLAKRIAVLKRNKHTEVNLLECADMQKLDAVRFALAQADAFSADERAVLEAYVKAQD
jgi:hypothetical protein